MVRNINNQEDSVVLSKKYLFDTLENIKNPKLGIKTGYIDFDYQQGGFIPGGLSLIGARPAMGKTSLAINMTLQMSMEQSTKVAYFSLADSKENVVKRLLAMESMVDAYKLRSGILKEDDWKVLVNAAEKMGGSSIVVNDFPEISIEDFEEKLKLDIYEDVKVIFIDYIQIMRTEHKAKTRAEELRYISQKLKEIATERDIAIVVLSQVSHDVEEREEHRPTIADLKDRDITTNLFDTISFIYRDEYYDADSDDKGIAEIITVRNKYYCPGTVMLAWLPEYQRFCSLEHRGI